MAREMEFSGWWEGYVTYTCDCQDCKNKMRFSFDSESEAKNFDYQNKRLKDHGWQNTKVNNTWKNFCSEKCRNKYIRKNTI